MMNKMTIKNTGNIALKDKYKFLMSKFFFKAKIFSKFVSIHSQVEINRRKNI